MSDDMPEIDDSLERFEETHGLHDESFPTIEKCRALAGVSFFSGISDRALEAIAAQIEVKSIKPDQVLIRRGEIGESLFIVVAGSVRVHHDATTIATLKKGQVFGELAALTPECRSASVTALEEGTVFQVSGRVLYDFLEVFPELVFGITRALCGRLREALEASDRKKIGNSGGTTMIRFSGAKMRMGAK